MSLCIASGSLLATLPLAAFTLAWTHSIEKTRWEEDWRIHDMKLELTVARIRGSGAGMEIPAGATLRDGVWHYVPMLLPQGGLLLRHSPYVTGYELCAENHCRPRSLRAWKTLACAIRSVIWACSRMCDR